MSIHMRRSHIRDMAYLHSEPCEERIIPWRELCNQDIEEFTEPGLMLQGARAAADLTQAEVAKKLGIKQSHVSEMEHGKCSIGKEMAHRLAKLFNVNYRLFL
jgi:DNA-binding XRE family transcriptional regulator